MPLTGDASDRRYFRILLDGRDPIVLALHAGAIDFAHAAVRERRGTACAACRCRCRRSSATPTRSASSRCRISGDVTLQAHLGAAAPPSTRRSTARRSRSSSYLQRRGAELASDRLSAVPHRVRRREADVGARFLRRAFPRGLSRRRARRVASGRRSRRRVGGDRRRARGGAARALPSRLSQPQPDAARGQLHIIDFQDARHGAGHLRSRVAAARFVRRHHRPRARRADRVLPGAQGRHRATRRSSGGGSI